MSELKCKNCGQSVHIATSDECHSICELYSFTLHLYKHDNGLWVCPGPTIRFAEVETR